MRGYSRHTTYNPLVRPYAVALSARFSYAVRHGLRISRREIDLVRRGARTVVVQKLFDQVDVGEDHSSTAVPVQSKDVHCLPANPEKPRSRRSSVSLAAAASDEGWKADPSGTPS